MTRKIIGVLIITAGITGCVYNKEELLYPGSSDCSTLNISFSADIQPIIQSSCAVAGCHDASSGNKGGPFINYTQIKNKATTIKNQVVAGKMPQGSTLTSNQIKLIRCWVEKGALNN